MLTIQKYIVRYISSDTYSHQEHTSQGIFRISIMLCRRGKPNSVVDLSVHLILKLKPRESIKAVVQPSVVGETTTDDSPDERDQAFIGLS